MYYVRRNELSAQEVDGEVVLLDAAGERIHQLNGTASLIWHRCDDKTTIDDLVELLMAHFDVDRTTAHVSDPDKTAAADAPLPE